MKRGILVVFGCFYGILTVFAQKRPFDYREVFEGAETAVSRPLPDILRWLDDDHYLERRQTAGGFALFSVEAVTGKSKPYRGGESGQAGDPMTGGVGAAGGAPGDAVNPVNSPDGKWVAYTRKNDLFAKERRTGKEIRFSRDGSADVYNGYAAWVYYEEILHRESNYRAFWWSPDSRHIAFIHFDETAVPVFPIYHSEGQHGFLENRHYPEAGNANPKVKMGIVSVDNVSAENVSVDSPATVWADFDEQEDQYFHQPFWVPDGSALWVQWMPRNQHEIKIFSVDIHSGKKKEIYSEKQKTWVNEKYISFLEKTPEFIMGSDTSGWNHFYLYNRDGGFISAITQGNFSVTGIVAVDEKEKTLYFTARKENSARIDFYKTGFDGNGLTRLSFGQYSHDAINLSPHAKYFITTYSNLSTPPRMALVDTKGRFIRQLADSKGSGFENYEWGRTELLRIKSKDSLFELPVKIIYPLHFDPAKKYPVFIQVYGGPDLGKVYDQWSADLREQWWAREGMIQVWLDDRASGHFGKAGMNGIYRQLGKKEIEDFMDGARWLRKQSFVDTSRICVFGFSFGGYMTCMALTYGADVFTHGLAYYPVTDWSLYDSYYTEKYMGTPRDNPEGYQLISPVHYAENYKGLLRIVHGTTDDNAHLQNTLQFISRLQELDKHFELMIYPGERHGRGRWDLPKRTHSYHEDERFIYENLLGRPLPADFRK